MKKIPLHPIAICLSAIFLAFQIATADRLPNVWMDEVMYTDPGANLYFGKGFVSSAWYSQNADDTWASYPPLYPLVLTGWMKVFGFSVTSVRSFGYVLFFLAGLMSLLAAIRLKLVKTRKAQVIFVVLAWLGHGISMSYRSGRPDGLGFFMVALLALAWTLRYPRVRWATLFGVALFIPWIQLQVVAFLGVVLAVVVFYRREKAFREVMSIGLGLTAGVISLVATLMALGLWKDFITAIRVHTALEQTGFRPWNIGKYFLLDISSTSLAIGVALWLWVDHRKRGKWNLYLAGVLAWVVSVRVSLEIAGKFHVCYSWMIYIPLAIAFVGILEQWRKLGPAFKVALGGITLLACVGFPARCLVAASRWNETGEAPIKKLCDEGVRSEDWVAADFAAYYVLKPRVERIFVTSNFKQMTEEQRARITSIVMNRWESEEWRKHFPGRWKVVAERRPASNEELLEGFGLRPFLRKFGSPAHHFVVLRRD